MSLYLKNSLNLTLKELNEVESRICFGISFQALAPWYPKDFLQYSRRSRGISKSSIFLVLYLEIFDLGVNLNLMMALQSTETRNITLKNLALFRLKLCDSHSTNQIAIFVNYCCYGVNVIKFSFRLKNLKHSHGIETRSRDSIMIPLMIEENWAMFFTVSL